MAKLAPASIKYVVKATIKAKGIVDKPDVIGAVFGQTEGLLGADLDLRELQQTGKIGRIEVKLTSQDGNSEGEIIIPSALDAPETSLIAATLETIERIGPCTATIVLQSVEDVRADKRKFVVDKAKEILKGLMDSGEEVSEITANIKESVRTHEITSYQGLPAGPDVEESEDIIIVEGRADILNLLRYGIRNTVAIEGTSVPKPVADLTKQKTTTLFVDGDRGGQLIARELFQVAEVDFVATAPDGKEVEDLTRKEAFKALRDRLTVEEYKARLEGKRGPAQRHERSPERAFDQPERHERPHDRPAERRQHVVLGEQERELFRRTLDELVGTRAACIYAADGKLLGKVPVSELSGVLKTLENPHTVIFDGRIDFTLNSFAKKKGIRFLVGMEKEDFRSSVALVSRKDLE